MSLIARTSPFPAAFGRAPFAVTAGTLPAGLTLNAATGAITGTPTSGGGFSFTITATDAAFSTGSRAYSGSALAALTLNPTGLPATTQNIAYSQSVTALGGTAPYTYALVGTLPTGLSLNTSTGAITGTPTAAGTFNFSINASDSLGAFGTRAYSIVIANAPIVVNPATLPGGTVGTAYSQTLVATGGSGGYTYGATGSLPSGLTLTSGGVLSGTPTTGGSFTFTVTATDSALGTGMRSYTVVIANAPIVVNPGDTARLDAGCGLQPDGVSDRRNRQLYVQQERRNTASGSALNAATGAITGTPTATGTRNFTIRATDGNGAFGSRAYSVIIAAAIVVNPATLPGGTVGSAYSRTVTTTGGTGTKTFSVSAGALPTGLSLNASTGVISGTPTSAGSSAFTIRATDTIGAIGARAYGVTINPAITLSPATLPNGTSGTPYSRTVSASGGTGTFTYSVSAGSLGAGLALNAATGVISGTPTTVGTRNFTIRATDGNATFGSQAYSITINAAITVNPATLANGTVGTPYSRTVSATGGSGPTRSASVQGRCPRGWCSTQLVV